MLASHLLTDDNALVMHDEIRGGRILGSKNFVRGASTWITSYIDVNPAFPDHIFRRRFSIPRVLYFRIKDDLLRHREDYWKKRRNGIGRGGIPTDLKLLSCFRILSSGNCTDSVDDAACISEESVRIYFRQFCQDLMEVYGSRFFNRFPTSHELLDVQQKYADIGFPGCIGAIDCMHYYWKNCPGTDKGQFQNSRVSKLASVQCEGWCDHDLYCWSWFAGRPGTNNDLNVLARSPLFKGILSKELSINVVQGYKVGNDLNLHHMLYFLGDGIYPRWPFFVLPMANSIVPNERKFSFRQESVRKDIERLFGIMQGRFEIIRRESRRWDLFETIRISNTCVTLHNLIVRMKQKCDNDLDAVTDIDVDCIMIEANERMMESAEERRVNIARVASNASSNIDVEAERYMLRDLHFTDHDEHIRLQNNLVVHNTALNDWE